MTTRVPALLFALTVLAFSPAHGEPAGTLTGIVVDELNGAPVRGANVTAAGLTQNGVTDLNGLFEITLPAGEHQVMIDAEGFVTETLTSVRIAAGDVNNVGVVLRSRAGAAGASETAAARVSEVVTVTATAESSTEAALLTERRTADEISDSVGRQEITKTADSTSAGVMQRVTGVSVVDDRYVYVRGLGERYSNTTLNGSLIPTTEPEKRVVPLDLFAANLLNKITVAKSYTPDKPGEFAAGFVELETLDFPTRPTISFSGSLGYDSGATGEAAGIYGGGLSWSGAGGEPLPQSFPSVKVARRGLIGTGFTQAELEQFGESLAGTWIPNYTTLDPNSSYALTLGNTFGRLGVVVSGSYSSSFDHVEEHQNFYQVGGGDGELDVQHEYDFTTSEETVRRGLVGNLAYRLSGNHQVKLRTLFTGTGTSEVRFFEGFNGDAFTNLEDTRLRYQNEEITTAQLSGDHFLQSVGGSSGSLVEWKISSSSGDRQENLRETLYEENDGVFVLADESQSGFFLFNDLQDRIESASAGWSSFFSDRVTGSIKAGLWYDMRARDFASRRFRLAPLTGHSLDLSLPADQLFTAENIGPGGFELAEETRATDTYEGEHDIGAAYLMGDAAFGRWRFVGGLRVEESDQRVITFDQFNLSAPPIETVNRETDFLPSLSAVYQINAATNLRAAFSQTVNRPEFRELAPFEFTDVVGGRAIVGNPELTRAEIRSYDLRWEWFPAAGEVVAVSAFLKDIIDPIERVIQPTAQLRTSFANAESAENYGVELEFRRNLAFLSNRLEPLTIITNYTLIESTVEIGQVEQSVLTNLDRPLAGQSDHVFNGTVEYAPVRLGATVRLLYNYNGEKISDVGAYGLPDLVEEPRGTLDLVWLQDLGRLADGLRLKLTGENLLDEERLFTQGGLEQRRYDPGREISVGISYSVF